MLIKFKLEWSRNILPCLSLAIALRQKLLLQSALLKHLDPSDLGTEMHFPAGGAAPAPICLLMMTVVLVWICWNFCVMQRAHKNAWNWPRIIVTHSIALYLFTALRHFLLKQSEFLRHLPPAPAGLLRHIPLGTADTRGLALSLKSLSSVFLQKALRQSRLLEQVFPFGFFLLAHLPLGGVPLPRDLPTQNLFLQKLLKQSDDLQQAEPLDLLLLFGKHFLLGFL